MISWYGFRLFEAIYLNLLLLLLVAAIVFRVVQCYLLIPCLEARMDALLALLRI